MFRCPFFDRFAVHPGGFPGWIWGAFWEPFCMKKWSKLDPQIGFARGLSRDRVFGRNLVRKGPHTISKLLKLRRSFKVFWKVAQSARDAAQSSKIVQKSSKNRSKNGPKGNIFDAKRVSKNEVRFGGGFVRLGGRFGSILGSILAPFCVQNLGPFSMPFWSGVRKHPGGPKSHTEGSGTL